MNVLNGKITKPDFLNAVLTCPSGQHIENGVCVMDDAPTCSPGYTWNGSKCVPDTQPCGAGYYRDETGECVPEANPCPSGYHHDTTGLCVPDTNPTCGGAAYPDEVFPPFMGTPCDSILESDPHRCTTASTNATGKLMNATGKEYHNAGGTGAVILTAILGVVSTVGGIFGAKENQKLAQDQLALEQAQQEQKRRTTTNLIIGGITFVIFGVAAFVVVRYIKNRNAIAK